MNHVGHGLCHLLFKRRPSYAKIAILGEISPL